MILATDIDSVLVVGSPLIGSLRYVQTSWPYQHVSSARLTKFEVRYHAVVCPPLRSARRDIRSVRVLAVSSGSLPLAPGPCR